MQQGDIIWEPSKARAEATQMFAFMRAMAGRYGFAADWPSLHRWSVEHRDQFWGELLTLARVVPSQSSDTVCSGEGMLGTKWFPGMQLNFAQHLLRFDDDRIAIQAEDERGRTRQITYRELRNEVARCAAALRRAGVTRGDRIAGFIPNIPEAVIAMIATASIGAIWSSCSPDFGIKGVLDRFGQIKPKVLFAADGYCYNGKPIDSLARIGGIIEQIPSIERVVVIGFESESPDLSAQNRAISWHQFLDQAPPPDTRVGRTGVSPVLCPELTFEQVPFDHPLFIMYSSGTTGVPKCIVHGAGGTLLQHMKELMLHCDLRQDDVIFYFTTCGWMMWNWVVSSLGVGATLVLYEGSPSYPDLHQLWQMAERFGITVFGTSPKFLSACENAGIQPGSEQDLSKLRCVLSTGSPLTIENFNWVYTNIKPDLQLSSISGGTDIISCFMLGNPILPVRAGEIQCLGLGMDVHAYDDAGQKVIGQKGELVCVSPFPSQPVRFWNDPNGEKYRKAYFEHYPSVWRHGDYIEITTNGGVVVYGRSDATLNPGGVRIGTAEIYRLVESMDEVIDSLVVGKQVTGDVEVCLFVVLRDGTAFDKALCNRIKQRIAEGATKRHIPRHIHQVTAIPYTISGKKVELAVTQVIHNQKVANRDALANPEALDQYRNLV